MRQKDVAALQAVDGLVGDRPLSGVGGLRRAIHRLHARRAGALCSGGANKQVCDQQQQARRG